MKGNEINLIKSKSGNAYYLDVYKKQFLIIHPVLEYIFKLYNQGVDLDFLFEKISKKALEIEGIYYQMEEVLYYYKKFIFCLNNGFFENGKKKSLREKITSDSVFRSFVESNQLLFEVTEDCNMECYYCAYGDLYSKNKKRLFRKVNVDKIKIFLSYIIPYWKKYNTSDNRIISVYFYGGEPLLNISAVKEIVALFKMVKIDGISFVFGLTTNGVLIKKYIDFLVGNNFNVTVSFDGNKSSSKYRKLKNGNDSFDLILENLLYVKENNIDYFYNNISFISVLHNLNNVPEVSDFIYDVFDKNTNFSELSKNYVLCLEELNKIYKSNMDHLECVDCFFVRGKKYLSRKDCIKKMMLNYCMGFCTSFRSLFNFCDNDRLLTGVCFPFSKKIYLSVEGNIYPCERIGCEYSMGVVKDGTVDIDFDKISDKYNSELCKIKSLCSLCFNNLFCDKCLFFFDSKLKEKYCDKFLSMKEWTDFLSSNICYLENNRGLYVEIDKSFNSIID